MAEDHPHIQLHLVNHLWKHSDGIEQNPLVQHVADRAGVHADEHDAAIVGWLDPLISTGHVRRTSEDGVQRLSLDQRRRDHMLTLQHQHLFE